ncbi:urea amidolyase associated protein UAAP2 [Treponema primitia]|uniref:urea amidolyase associated protein UAAP2 n=1 Tax=Treponema primitia TaxID=88058 RepID=UPI0002554CC8|nr:urea amidolyase associated protein UAAP2 [Treponema primitia]
MGFFKKVESSRKEEDACFDKTVLAGNGWIGEVKKGQFLRLIDVGGNQAADTLFYDAEDVQNHYSAIRTIVAQKNIYLTTGTVLLAENGKPLFKIVADTCGNHDTLGGACSAQSNTVRYGHETLQMHNCRDTFLLEIAKYGHGLEKADLVPNINFYMNVPVTPDGGLEFADGVSAPGYYFELEAMNNAVFLLSCCPQLNNPCNAYNPTPLRVLIWDK